MYHTIQGMLSRNHIPTKLLFRVMIGFLGLLLIIKLTPSHSFSTTQQTQIANGNTENHFVYDGNTPVIHQTQETKPQAVNDVSFFPKAIEMLVRNKPENIPELKGNERAPSYYYIDIPNPTFTIDFLKQFTEMSQGQFTEMKNKHDLLKKDILNMDYPKDTFKGKGIVMVAGGAFLGTALTSILALRETGSELPLELVLTSFDEYQEDVCQIMLPKLNARCIIMEELVGSEVFQSLNLQKYELKVLGLFLSSFEDALLLDADNLSVKSPDYILDSKPYEKHGYILWMDFWRQTISPYFYEIAGVDIGEPIRKDGVYPDDVLPPRDKAQLSDLEGAIPDSTCEAGQVAINKKRHFKALLATVYYNLFGFKFYYQLLGQGAVGIGDKDTFIAGLTVFQEPTYFVRQRPLLLGYDYEGGWQDTTMVQYDPAEDFEYYEQAKEYMKENGIDTRNNLFLNVEASSKIRDEIHQNINKTKPSVQFLHMHNPKFNAKTNYVKGDYSIDGHPRRQFGDREKLKETLHEDWELKFLRISEFLACECEIIPDDWKSVNREEYCQAISKHVKWLRETSDTPQMGILKNSYVF